MAAKKRPKPRAKPSGPARIEYLRVENYRALRSVEFKALTPLTVLLGPNGSGKSTVFDVFNFLSGCFQFGLRHAWDRRGRAKELKTRGQDGPVTIERRGKDRGRPFKFLDYKRGRGAAVSGDEPDETDRRVETHRNTSASFRALRDVLNEFASSSA